MASTFEDALAISSSNPWWYVAIEGIRKRFGTWQPAWNPADSGTNRYIDLLLADPPVLGSQEAHPLKGRCDIPEHQFVIHDYNSEITEMLAVSDTPKNKTLLTAGIDADDVVIPVSDYSDFPSSGDVFLGRETINYSTKITNSGSGTADVVTGTADSDPGGASDVRIYDAARTEGNDYWLGGEIVFTGGSNSGQVRRIMKFTYEAGSTWHDYEEQDNTMYLDPNNPLPNNVSAGDTYKLRMPPGKMYDAALASSSNYWSGAQVLITADTDHPENIGEVRYVKSWNDSTHVAEFYGQFPSPIGDGTGYSIKIYKFGGCTRGMYDSIATEHSVLDSHGEAIPIHVVDAPQFIKTRRAWIYTSIQGLDESESKVRIGIIDGYSLDGSGEAYRFECSGLLKALSGKILWKQKSGLISKKPLWGGAFYLRTNSSSIPELNVGWRPWPIMQSDVGGASESNFSVTEVYYESESEFNAPGNVKINEEIIRTESGSTEMIGFGRTGNRILHLGEHADFDEWVAGIIVKSSGEVTSDKLCMHARGLFADKIGMRPISSWAGGINDWPTADWGQPPVAPSVNALMQEHQIGDEIVEVIVCDDTPASDFPRYDEIRFDSPSGTIGSVGSTITGTRSQSTATLIDSDDVDDGIIRVIDADGEFYPEEQISDGGGWVGYITEIRIGNGEDLPARNNPINVFLQLICSTGNIGYNGRYDTLPFGWGMNPHFDVANIDMATIELLRDTIFKSARIDFCMHEPATLLDWMQKNVFRFFQIFPFETYDGRLSLSYLYTEPECQHIDDGTLREIDADDLDATVLPSWGSGPSPVTRVLVKYNRHPVNDDYYSDLEINFINGQTYYRDFGRTVEIKCASLYWPSGSSQKMGPNDPSMPDMVARLINPMWGRHSTHPCPVIGVRLDSLNYDINIGDIVKLTQSNMPNLRTGQRGFSNEYFQVIGVEHNLEGSGIDVTLWQVGVHDLKYGRKAPSAAVYSYQANVPSAGKSRINLYQNIYSRTGEYDRDWFEAGDYIMVMDADTYAPIAGATPEEVEVAQVGAGSNFYLQFDSLFTTAPSQGNIVEIARYDAVTSARKSREVFHADEDRVLGSADDTAFKYR